MNNDGYDSYEDWYDHGPGSESFKREIAQSNLEHIKNQKFPLVVGKPKTMSKKTKNSRRALTEQIEALNRHLKANVKMIPHININKGLLEEIVKHSRRILKYVEGIENDQNIS